jgi:hypothetical protein
MKPRLILIFHAGDAKVAKVHAEKETKIKTLAAQTEYPPTQ